MTTPSTERKAGPLLGTGAQTTWPFTFKVFAATDIAVTIADSLGVETALTYGVDYAVTLNANQETSPGGTVTYPISGSPLPVGKRLVIVGNLPYDQPLDLPSGGNFSPLALENQLDRLTMQIQQLREQMGRSLTVPVTSGVSPSLPSPIASNIIGWNKNGDNLENYPLSELATTLAFATYRYDTFTGNGSTTQFTLSADPVTLGNLDVAVGGVTQTPGADYLLVNGVLAFTSPPPLGATILARFGEGIVSGPSMDSYNVRFRQAGTSAVDRTVENKLRETVSVLDYGADPSGVNDSTAAIQAAFNAAKQIALGTTTYGITVYFPRGVYRITSTITVPMYCNVIGENTEGVIIEAGFNGDAFTDEVTAGGLSATYYFARFEEISIYKSSSSGANNTTGKAINFRAYATYCVFKRLRIYGGEYAIYGQNLGYSLWNTFDKVVCYYQSVANMYIGQGSNADIFYDCSFAYAPIGVDFPGSSFAVSMHGCAFEGFTTAAIQIANGQVSLHGGYIEMYQILASVVKVTGTGQVDIVGMYVRGPGPAYLATLDGDGVVRYSNCLISNYTYNPPAAGAYAANLRLRDNSVALGTNTAVAGTVQGTFTPTLSPTVAGDYTIAYSKQFGRYRKEGNRVTIDVEIVTSTFTHSTASGYMRVQGIPFNGSTTTGAQSKGGMEFSGITKAGYTQLAPSIDHTNNQQVIFMASGSGVASGTLNIGDMPSGSNKTIRFTLTYETAY